MEKIAQQHVEHVSSVDVDAVYEFIIRCSSLRSVLPLSFCCPFLFGTRVCTHTC